MALKVVIAYDISNDNTRAQVAAMISSWGDRIQRSVYKCLLSSDELEELLGRIDRVINHGSDTVHVFHQCATCTDHAHYLGQAHQTSPEPYWIL